MTVRPITKPEQGAACCFRSTITHPAPTPRVRGPLRDEGTHDLSDGTNPARAGNGGWFVGGAGRTDYVVERSCNEGVAVSDLVVPWGLSRMRPYPDREVGPAVEVVLDPGSQTGRWLGADGTEQVVARHKRSETSRETQTRTSLDGNTDQGSDQEGDTD
ncbi:putative ATP-grasp-modified RiPP [Streptomyces sp. enrichment culture]|uniref:putative ATP-grasp-modified RiPP n=1 Tax=Streptomyces sp. enrichment culture TaxID=1795815 RepID=UPI003F572756